MSPGLISNLPRSLGDRGLVVGPLAFGCWRFVAMSPKDAMARIEAGLEAGMNLVDTADAYGLDWGGAGFGAAEELLGKVLALAPGLRDRMVLATKGGIVPPIPYDSGSDALVGACEASLGRLGVETVDLYQVHRSDLFTHPAVVAEALSGLREAGKIREVGVSNFTVAQYDALAAYLPFPIAAVQPQFSAHHLAPMRDGTMDRMMAEGTTVLAWSPLAGGALADGEGSAVRPQLLSVLDRLAKRERVDRAAVSVAFVLSHPCRPVAILGSQNLARIAAAQRALTVNLDRNDLYDIVEASEGVPLP